MDKGNDKKFDIMIEYLIGRKFQHYNYTDIEGTSGNQERIDEVNLARDMIRIKRDETIIRLYNDERDRELESLLANEEIDDEVKFFNRGSANANLKEGIKSPYWTPEEAVAYSLNKNPVIVNSHSIRHYADLSPFVAEYMKRKGLVERALEVKDLRSYGPYNSPAIRFKPVEFISWAVNVFNSIPKEFEEVVNRVNWEARYKASEQKLDSQDARIRLLEEKLRQYEKPLHPRKEVSYQKLLYVYLIQDHKISIGSQKTDSVGKILRRMSNAQLDMDDETVRNIVRNAVEFCVEYLKEKKP